MVNSSHTFASTVYIAHDLEVETQTGWDHAEVNDIITTNAWITFLLCARHHAGPVTASILQGGAINPPLEMRGQGLDKSDALPKVTCHPQGEILPIVPCRSVPVMDQKLSFPLIFILPVNSIIVPQ